MIDRSLRRLLLLLLVCFGVLFVQVSRVQVIDAEELRNNPDNARSILRDFNQPRGGRIMTADNVVVARSDEVFGSVFDHQRRYPEGELYAHVAGYYSFNLGTSGVEKAYNDSLSGRSAELRLSGLNAFLGGAGDPGDVHLTLLHSLQERARVLLGDRVGSVVMIEPDTGALLAMYSSPSFDPNSLAAHDGRAAEAAAELLDGSHGNPRRPSAYADVYFPGSAFKVVTAAAVLESDVVDGAAIDVAPAAEYFPPLVSSRPIRNSGGGACGGSVAEMLASSCNTGFAYLAAEQLGPPALIAAAESFGFNTVPPLDIAGGSASVFPTDYGERLRDPDDEVPAGIYEGSAVLAQAALGQNSVSASPLTMSLIAAAVANGGEIPSPHVVGEIRTSAGEAVQQIQPGPWKTAVDPETAIELGEDMRGAVTGGTARRLAIPGLEIGAKTGTAQVAEDFGSSHAWVIGFAGDPGFPADVAFAVFVGADPDSPEQSGSRTAVPIAKDLLNSYFGL